MLCATVKFTTTELDWLKLGLVASNHLAHIDQLLVTLSSLISYTCQMGVSLLTVLSHHTAVIVRVFPQEAFRVVVAVNVDLGQSIVGCWLFTAFMDTRLEPGQEQLQPARTADVRTIPGYVYSFDAWVKSSFSKL